MADEKSKRFTFDSDKDSAEVPTLTSLLYKKNAVKTQTNTETPFTLEPTQSQMTITKDQIPEMGTGTQTGLEVKKSTTPLQKDTMKLVEFWDNASKDKTHCLFESAKSLFTVPGFKSGVAFEKQNTTWTAHVQMGAKDQLALCCDLEWDESITPEFTDMTKKSATFEIGPLSDVNQPDAALKKAIRTAFGIKNTDWVTLTQTTIGQKTYLLVLQSTQSIQKNLPQNILAQAA